MCTHEGCYEEYDLQLMNIVRLPLITQFKLTPNNHQDLLISGMSKGVTAISDHLCASKGKL